MFGTFYLLVMAWTIVETLILPPLADVSPRFVGSLNCIFSGEPGPLDLGAVEALNPPLPLFSTWPAAPCSASVSSAPACSTDAPGSLSRRGPSRHCWLPCFPTTSVGTRPSPSGSP